MEIERRPEDEKDFSNSTGGPPTGQKQKGVVMINSRNSGASKGALIGLFTLIALMLVASGYWYYRQTTRTIRIQEYSSLKAIADLKVSQIIRWRNERIGDARLNSAAPLLRSAVIQWLKTPGDGSLKAGIKAHLQLLKESYGYENVFLASTNGSVLLTLNPVLTNLEIETKRLITKTVSARSVVFDDFFRCSLCNQVHLDVAAPIFNQAEEPAAVLILRTDPLEYLYPLIQSWPTPSPSAETLLIRKDGDDALYLNVLRHRADQALTLRIPLSRTEVPAVQAVKGKTGLFEGLDYRNVKVLADIRIVPGSPWFMVAKVDRDEILAKVADETRLIGFLTLALVVLSGVGTAFIYKHQGKRTFQALFRAEHEKAELLEQARVTLYSIGDAVIATGPDGRVRQMNPVAEKLTGWKEAEAVGKPLSQVFCIFNEETRAEVENPVERVLREGFIIGLANHTLLIARDGTERLIADSGAPIRNEAGEIIGVVLVFRDQAEEQKNLTERKRAQEALLALSAHQEALLSAIPDIIMEVDENKIYTWANPTGFEFFGEEVIGKEAAFYFEGEQKTYNTVQPLFNGSEDVIYLESWQRRKDGQKRLLAWWCRVLKDEQGKVRGALSSARDITDHKLAEEALWDSEERYRQVVENANEAIFVVQDETIKFYNPKTVEILGFSRDHLPSVVSFMEFIHPEDQEMVLERYQKRLKGEDLPQIYTFRVIDRERKIRWAEINSVLISWEGRPATLVFLSDITERKTTEEKIILAKEEWERTFDSVPDLIAIVGDDFRISRVNRAMADRLHLTPKEMVGRWCYELIHGTQGPPSICPHNQVMRDGKETSTEIHEPRLGGHFLLTASPLTGADGRFLGVIHVFRDITERKQAEEKVVEEGKKLQKAIEGIVQAMAATVEVKDPYTAGHQRRVADLARAIAQEMGFSDDRIEGIHMAGMIHDLGKLSVPAEILSKPTELSEIEFSLIKVHPQAGYDILKEIDFPWPIARIVFQHHERINGSGYPMQIKGEEILPEAKVLAVADVVEAIASYRPYRPALGLDKALEEIQQQKGVLYDSEVVEVCLKLFQEKGYSLG